MNLMNYNINRLKRIRIEKGISQTYMARRLGYKTPSGYANIESGKIKLTLETALMISEIIEVDFHVFFFD